MNNLQGEWQRNLKRLVKTTEFDTNSDGCVDVEDLSIFLKTYPIAQSYNYDAFGNQLDENKPNDTNPFRYCGEYWDEETGEIYLRARYYNSKIGRFAVMDTHWNTGNMIYGDSMGYSPNLMAIRQSTNLYVYCLSNPIKFIDKTGNNVFDVIKGWFDGIFNNALNDSGFEKGSIFDGYDDEADYFVSGVMGYNFAEFAKNNNIYFDVTFSFSASVPVIDRPVDVGIGYTYLQGNANDYTAGYIHVGAGKSVSLLPVGVSMSLGIVKDSPLPQNYAGPFIDVNAALGIGIDHCMWPGGASAIAITVGTNAGAGLRFDYYILVHSESDGEYELYEKK